MAELRGQFQAIDFQFDWKKNTRKKKRKLLVIIVSSFLSVLFLISYTLCSLLHPIFTPLFFYIHCFKYIFMVFIYNSACFPDLFLLFLHTSSFLLYLSASSRSSRTAWTPLYPETVCCGIPYLVVCMHSLSTQLTLPSFLFTMLYWVST